MKKKPENRTKKDSEDLLDMIAEGYEYSAQQLASTHIGDAVIGILQDQKPLSFDALIEWFDAMLAESNSVQSTTGHDFNHVRLVAKAAITRLRSAAAGEPQPEPLVTRPRAIHDRQSSPIQQGSTTPPSNPGGSQPQKIV
jgi:hypothetical protein